MPELSTDEQLGQAVRILLKYCQPYQLLVWLLVLTRTYHLMGLRKNPDMSAMPMAERLHVRRSIFFELKEPEGRKQALRICILEILQRTLRENHAGSHRKNEWTACGSQ